MEQEIEKILASIDHKDLSSIKSYDEIHYIRNKVIDDTFDDFMDYPKNCDNLDEYKKLLKEDECMYIDYRDLEKNDNIYYLDYYIFYNIKLVRARVTNIYEERGYLNIYIDSEEIYRSIKLDSIIFKVLSDEDKAKISLVEIINN
jgi:hypothetical protein